MLRALHLLTHFILVTTLCGKETFHIENTETITEFKYLINKQEVWVWSPALIESKPCTFSFH